jgi:hypothetical protein
MLDEKMTKNLGPGGSDHEVIGIKSSFAKFGTPLQ